MWRQNPKPKRLKIRNGEILLACQHVHDSLFDQDFDEDAVNVMSVVAYKIGNDTEHRWYLACNNCDTPESLEELLENLYPTLGPLRISKRIRPLFDDWWLAKRPLVINVNDLLRTHYMGEGPEIGDLVHYCDAAKTSKFVYMLKFETDEAGRMELEFEEIDIPAFTLLCPNCYVEGSGEDLEDMVEEKIWTNRDKSRLKQQVVIFKGLGDFVDYAEARDTPEEPEEMDLVLKCEHMAHEEEGKLYYIEEILDAEMYNHPEEGPIVVSWMLMCNPCVESHKDDIPAMFNRAKRRGEFVLWDDDDEDDDFI
jgi:hypothetical protein